jgi:hypothetical protein
MLKEQCRVGMTVIFGRDNGEKTTGKIIKMNPTKAKVQIDVSRGYGRGVVVGSVWGVPYSMMQPVDAVDTPQAPKQASLDYSPFDSGADQHIMQAINCVYGELSPENLTCDGELSRNQVAQRYAELHRKLRSLFAALGREVSEEAAWKWEQSRQEYLKQRG